LTGSISNRSFVGRRKLALEIVSNACVFNALAQICKVRIPGSCSRQYVSLAGQQSQAGLPQASEQTWLLCVRLAQRADALGELGVAPLPSTHVT
jgi:hypothetical protein